MPFPILITNTVMLLLRFNVNATFTVKPSVLVTTPVWEDLSIGFSHSEHNGGEAGYCEAGVTQRKLCGPQVPPTQGSASL